jgi:Kef-type K+ transport system membrane component KefB
VIDLPILRDLGVFLVAAALVALAGRLIRMPAIVTYIIAGLIVGPGLGLVEVSEPVELISTFGIALLLFVVGLELSFDKIRDVGKVAVVAGLGQVLFTAAGGFLVCLALGYSPIEAIFIGTALTFSSTVVVVKLLDEKNELHELYGRIAVGIFLVQDLVVVIVLTLLAGLTQGEGAEESSVLVEVLFAFGGMTLLLILALVAARWVLPVVLGWFADRLDALFIASLCWCLGLVLLAESLELSLEIGAFLAGISLAQLPFNDELRRRTRPLMNFFIAVFFVSLGSRMELDGTLAILLPSIALSLFVLIGNPLIFLWIISRMGYGKRTAFLTSVTVAQISEFSFVFAAMGLSAGLIDEAILSVIGLVGLVTIGVSAYMILYNAPLHDFLHGRRLLRFFRSSDAQEEERPPPREGHIVVVGVNALGRRIVAGLLERGEDVLLIDTDPLKLEGMPCDTMIGSIDDLTVFREAALRRAALVISTLQIEDVNRLLAYRCRSIGVPIAIHAFDQAVVRDLEDLDVDYLIQTKNEGVRIMAGRLADLGLVQ